MARYLSWFCSFFLHVAVALFLLQTVRVAPLELREAMEIDLTEMEMPDIVATVPIPQPLPDVESVPESQGELTPTPLPMDKTLVLADSPPPAASTIPPEVQPVPEPDVVEISSKKVKASLEKGVENPNRIIVRKNDTIVHRGHEARFGRSMMGDYFSYSATEFSGQFKTKDDRTISIIDARNTKYGRFLIYDSKNKTLRRMKEFGKYVYTIGPSIHEDEPVVGTVTFLARNDRIERLILVTDDDRIAHYPRKVHVREEDVAIPSAHGDLAGYASLPPVGESFPGVVFVHGNHCVEPGLVQGFTRALSARNLASMVFAPRMCGQDRATLGHDEQLVEDARSSMDFLASLAPVGPARAGMWGNGRGVPFAIQAAAHSGEVRPRYLVCLLDDTVNPDRVPGKAVLLDLTMPTLWLVTGRDILRWQSLITTLESLRDQDKRPFTIVVAPLKASQEVQKARSDNSGWVEQVAEDHARLAVSWIQRVLQ